VNDLTYRLVIRACRAVIRALGLQIEVRGADLVPERGPVVLAANHHGYLDFMLVGLVGTARGRYVRFLAKHAVFQVPVVGSAMRSMGHVSVDRDHGAAAARGGLRRLLEGEVVGVFPEATIGRSFTARERACWRRGAAYLAMATGAPLVPVAHWGGHRVATIGGRYSLRRGAAVQVWVGEPLVPRPAETAEELTTRLRERIAAMVGELAAAYPQPPQYPARTWWWPAHLGGAAPAEAGMPVSRVGGPLR
jgi:1-acyl-sn-glycerol-3-phosphate acyltransferase